MTRKLRAWLATVAAALAVVTFSGGYVLAATQGGPPVNQTPGPYFQQGTAVNVCVSTTNASVAYFELHSQKLGNCAAGFTQLTIEAEPTVIPPATSS
jgi:hypothetical protein